MKYIEIPLTKCKVVLTEAETYELLKSNPDILEAGIMRGKSFKRAATCEKRQANVDRWQLYEWLKGNQIPGEAASLIETMSIIELREGVIEFILTRGRKEKIL